jgi:hypothetical protein
MTRSRLAGVLLILALLCGSRLAGQSYRTFMDEWNSIRQGPGFRIGPLKVVPAVRLLDLGYDTNIYYRAAEDEVVADYTAVLSPEIKAFWPVGHSLFLYVTENPEYLFLLNETGLRTFTNSLSSGFRFLALQRFSLSAAYHARKNVRRSTSEFERPIESTVKGWDSGLFFETPRGTSAGVRVSSEAFRHRDIAAPGPVDYYARTLDRQEESAAFELYYRVFSESRLFASVRMSRDEFRDPASAWRNAHSVRAMAGIRFPLLGRARGQVSLGWKAFTPESPDREPFSGLVSATDVRLRFWRFGFDLGYVRDNYYSYLDTAYYYVEDRFRAGVSLYLMPFLRLDAGYLGGALDYPEPQIVWHQGQPVLVPDRRDAHRTWSAGLVVRLAGKAGLGLSYNLYRRSSNAPGYDIDRGFLGASLTYDF